MSKLTIPKDVKDLKDAKDASLFGRSVLSEDGLHVPSNVPVKLPTKIKLQSSDGKVFDLEYNIAKMSQTIKTMVEESENPVREDVPIKLSNVSSEALIKIIEYIKHYHKLPPFPTDELFKEKAKKCEIKDFDLKFVQSLDKNLLFELITASNFLFIRALIDLLCKHAANTFIRGKKIKEIREQFNIKNDFSAEEEKALKEENKWIPESD